VVDKAALGQVLHQVLQFPVSLTTPTLHTWFIYLITGDISFSKWYHQ
jgi:hypothetical protein